MRNDDFQKEKAPSSSDGFIMEKAPSSSDGFIMEKAPSSSDGLITKKAPPFTNRKTGDLGERLAAHHLESLGYRMLARNLKVGRLGELDLVAWAEDGRTVCFVEVKTRSSDRFGTPAESVTIRKQRRIRKMAGAWLSSHSFGRGAEGLASDIPVRFDVVEVMLDRNGRSAKVHHIPDAF